MSTAAQLDGVGSEGLKKHVYVVDDDLLVLDLVSGRLADAGYQVTAYGDSETFVAAAPSLAPGCVVLDLDMPGMNGLEVQEILVESGLSFHVIFYSGKGSVRHAVEGMRAGAADFLQKGSDLHPLLSALERGFRLASAR